MPRYEVIKPGFLNDKPYSPNGKRKVVVTDKAFKKCPSWLRPIKEESATQRKKREESESKISKENAKKAAQDKKDVDSVMFTQAPSRSQASVETL